MEEEERRVKEGAKGQDKMKGVVAVAEKASWRFVDHVRSLTNSRVINNFTLKQDSP